MIDWNNDGKVDGEDWMLTEMILDDEGQSEKKSGGGCLTSIVFFIGVPLIIFFMAQHFCDNCGVVLCQKPFHCFP
jgi:hypothetical protein